MACGLGYFQLHCCVYSCLATSVDKHESLLRVYAGVGELGWMVGVYLALEDTPK